jgi:hypothetical protein
LRSSVNKELRGQACLYARRISLSRESFVGMQDNL